MAQTALPPALAQAHQDYLAYLELRKVGREREGRPRLHNAVAAGHPGALYTLAVNEFEGPERNVLGALANLARASARGHSAARQMLAVLKAKGSGGAADWGGAVDLLIQGARNGDASALRDLAFLVEMAERGHHLSAQLLLQAAAREDVLAIHAVVARADAGAEHGAASADIAFWAQALRTVRHPRAHRIVAANGGGQRPEQRPLPPEAVWSEIRSLLARSPARSVAAKQIGESPKIFELRELMTAEECDYLIGLSTPLLKEAKVYNNVTGKLEVDPVRTALEGSLWPSNLTLAAHCLNERMAASVGVPAENGETTNILMYRPGDEFRPHYDFFTTVDMVPDFAQSGQRMHTLLTYLNTDYTEGQTHFLASDLKYRGEVGDAVLFVNTDAAGTPDHSSLHAGLPVAQGVKWLASKWFRQRAYWC